MSQIMGDTDSDKRGKKKKNRKKVSTGVVEFQSTKCARNVKSNRTKKMTIAPKDISSDPITTPSCIESELGVDEEPDVQIIERSYGTKSSSALGIEKELNEKKGVDWFSGLHYVTNNNGQAEQLQLLKSK